MSMGYWLVIALVMGIVEAFSAGLVTMWFVVGALVAFACAFFGASFPVQLVVFLVVSVACLVLLRPVILKHRNRGPSAEPTMIGRDARVTEGIAPGQIGRVEAADHMTWAARSEDDQALEPGTVVRVVGQQSITLVVERKQS